MGTPVDTILSVAKKNCLAGMGLIYSFCLLGAVGFRHFCHRGFGSQSHEPLALWALNV